MGVRQRTVNVVAADVIQFCTLGLLFFAVFACKDVGEDIDSENDECDGAYFTQHTFIIIDISTKQSNNTCKREAGFKNKCL